MSWAALTSATAEAGVGKISVWISPFQQKKTAEAKARSFYFAWRHG
jgi:hypothetical protein